MKRILYGMILLSGICMMSMYSYGAEQDANWQMWHGDQDAMILGTILRLDNENMTLNVEKRLFAKGIINDVYRQIPAEEIDDVLKIEKFERYETSYNDKEKPEIGDVIVISLDLGGEVWKVNWLPFEVSGKDYKNLEFLPTDRETPESFAWTTFIRTDGKMNDFTFVNDKNEEKVIGKGIFDDGKIVEDEIYTVTKNIPFTINAYFIKKNLNIILTGAVIILMGGLLFRYIKKK